MSVKDYWQTVC